MDTIKNSTRFPDDNPANRDPITKEPGSHPVGTGLGSAGGAVAGAAAGAVIGGPVGAAVGGVVGAVAGAAGGHAAGEAVNPTVEDAYWNENFKSRPYYQQGRTYLDYRTAYRYGWESAAKPEYRGRKFDEVEAELAEGWDSVKGNSSLAWHDTKQAAHDAWDRVHGD